VLKTDIRSNGRKWEMFKIAQENTYLLKRINERTSFYNTKQSLRSYDKTKAYKNNICVFPNIDFHKTIDNSTGVNSLRYGNLNFNETGIRYVKTPDHRVCDLYVYGNGDSSFRGDEFNKTGGFSQTMGTNIEEHILSDNDQKKVFFNKKVFFADLYHCMVKFYVEDRK
jgi:hypothetical protein